MRKALLLLLGVIALLGASCGGDGGDTDGTPTGATSAPDDPTGDCEDVTGEDEVNIVITDNAFSPDCLVYRPVPVVFTNSGTLEHNFSIPDTPVDVDFPPGEESTITPSVWSTPGEFTFFCKYHGSPDGSGMAGTLTIVEG